MKNYKTIMTSIFDSWELHFYDFQIFSLWRSTEMTFEDPLATLHSRHDCPEQFFLMCKQPVSAVREMLDSIYQATTTYSNSKFEWGRASGLTNLPRPTAVPVLGARLATTPA